MGSVHGFLCKNLSLLVWGCWSSVSAYLLPLFRYLTRYRRNCGFRKNVSEDSKVVLAETNEQNMKVTESGRRLGDNQDFAEFSNIENGAVGEKEEPEVFFSFKFPSFEEFSKSNRGVSPLLNLVESSSVAEKNFSEFVDEPEAEDLEVSKVKTELNCGFLSQKDENQDDFEDEGEEEEEKEAAHEEILEDSSEKVVEEEDETDESDATMEDNLQKFNQESVSSSNDSDTDSISSNNFHSAMSNLVDAYGNDDGFLSDGDFKEEFDAKEEGDRPESNFLSEKDFGRKSIDIKESVGKNVDSNDKNLSNDSTNKLESLWEHHELIEQLKMEIKKVRAIRLPTIFEESESPPKIMEEFKPWKIEEAYKHVGHKLGEVHKFYKSYKERMRKFDIFSYQKMYATGFLQLNDPFQSVSSSRSLVPEIATHLCQSFSATKGKKRENNPTKKCIKELRSDLEVVYVGQMCLSWEILHWQYEKVLDIWESDPHGVHQFHEVAGEFQQFLVLLQRFMEEEPFHGPRVQNYVKSRCVFRNLLQVPVIREDSPKNRRKARSQVDGHGMSSDMLVEILEESIRLFWRFIRADKDRRKTPLEFQKPEDSQLFMEVQKDLHKKERKLKEQLRSGNCILRRLRRWKEEEDSDDQVLCFFCQIDLKLVARVLQMSRLTSDQLIWCQNQLQKVRFFNRKIHVEPSFLLFPC